MSLHEVHRSAGDLLADWDTPDVDQDALRYAYLSYLDANPDACSRSSAPGHLTASALVCDPVRRATLLTLHPRIGRWVQLGGHCEPGDVSITGAAEREAVEEGGIDDIFVDPSPLRLHVHPLTCSGGVPTRHLDVQFLVIVPEGAEETISDESIDLRWFAFDDLPRESDESVAALVRAARNRLSG